MARPAEGAPVVLPAPLPCKGGVFGGSGASRPRPRGPAIGSPRTVAVVVLGVPLVAGLRDDACVERRRVHRLLAAPVHRQALFTDPRYGLHGDEEAFLPYPEEAPGRHVHKAHLALHLVDVEIFYAAYLLALLVEDGVAIDVLGVVLEDELRVREPGETGLGLGSFGHWYKTSFGSLSF